MPKRDSKSPDATSHKRQSSTLIHHPQETLILCVVSALDVIMTYSLLDRSDVQFTESNPVARYFLDRWGIAGLINFKAVMTAVVCIATQLIARKHSALAKHVLGIATLIIVAVVVYSVWLHFQHRHVVDVIEARFRRTMQIDLV